jgi:hypothetical protein
MVRTNKIYMLLLIAAYFVCAVACSRNVYTTKAKGNDCGCPNKKGMVGY